MNVRIHDTLFALWLNPYLDGERLDDCTAASEEDGWVEVFCREPDGAYTITGDGKAIARRRLYGRVRLEARPDMPVAMRLLYDRERQASPPLP